MYLIECLNNEKTKDCNTLYNTRYNYRLKFSTSLEDVALLGPLENEEMELNNGHECYAIPYFDSIQNIWRIE